MEIKNVGDVVYMDSYTSMGQNALGGYNESTIEKIDYRFDEKSGDRFPIYKIGNDWYDGRDGTCYSNKDSMYYIEDYSECGDKRTFDDFKGDIKNEYNNTDEYLKEIYKETKDFDFE